jgi:CHAT domain-containing protein
VGLAEQQKQEKIEDEKYKKTALELSQCILQPIAAHLNKKRLLIVADGALQYLPFSALSKTDRNFRPLIVDHEVVSLPSVSVLLSLRRTRTVRPAPPGLVAVIADPVFNQEDTRFLATLAVNTPRAVASSGVARATGIQFERLKFTKEEAEKIGVFAEKIAKGSNRITMGFEANLDTIVQGNLSQYRIVHFATHGLLNSQQPELSGLVFSLFDPRGQQREGFLRLHDVFNLKLNADLVVLSGCQTAMGKEVRGEGLIGLTRGFFYAGSARVMASLWSVQDNATAKLMRLFYTRLLDERKSASEALRLAQWEMWNDGQGAPPYFWAAFTLQGDWQN